MTDKPSWVKEIEAWGDEDPTDEEIAAAFENVDESEVEGEEVPEEPDDHYFGDTVFESEEEADAFIAAALARMGRPDLMDDKSEE